jgi:predicted ArsR family transcriptional regulator
MAEESEGRIRDPKRLRALAHPLRWHLVDLLTSEGSATATRCAHVLGESVASCSYHLNMLAKYGFIEEAPGGEGREKPWRLTSPDLSFTPDGLDDESAMAGEAAVEAFLDHEFAVMKERLRRRSLESEPWQQAAGFNGSISFLTAKELFEVRNEVRAIFDRYRDRAADPALRPEGARVVRMFASTSVAPER